MKENTSIDVESGLVLSTWVSKASEHDTNFFQVVAVKGDAREGESSQDLCGQRILRSGQPKVFNQE